jgi:uncharacterized repeat protein (TIGR03803 family)
VCHPRKSVAKAFKIRRPQVAATSCEIIATVCNPKGEHMTSVTKHTACEIIMAAFTLLLTGIASAQVPTTYTKLYKFNGPVHDGASPFGNLVLNGGTIYGTTFYGGSDIKDCQMGCGTVFALSSTGVETVLYNFGSNPLDGHYPWSGMLRDSAGNLYGANVYGGNPNCASGCGTIFKVDPSGNETILYSFEGPPKDGGNPAGKLVMDAAGNLYGLSGGGSGSACGAYGCGVVFKLDPFGNETIIHNFTGAPDGSSPVGALHLDDSGNLYGTTEGGGLSCDCGTVFKLTTSGTETVLYRFTGTSDGGYPSDGLFLDSSGNFYGTTNGGGSAPCGGTYGCGVVFMLTPSGHETVIHSFTGSPSDGAGPIAGVVRDTGGNIYGVTEVGGVTTGNDCTVIGCGVVYKINKGGVETILHYFKGSPNDGANPVGGLLLTSGGSLYGTTADEVTGFGRVFEITQ